MTISPVPDEGRYPVITGPSRVVGRYEGAGSDTGTNPSLNREWVAIKKNGSRAW